MTYVDNDIQQPVIEERTPPFLSVVSLKKTTITAIFSINRKKQRPCHRIFVYICNFGIYDQDTVLLGFYKLITRSKNLKIGFKPLLIMSHKWKRRWMSRRGCGRGTTSTMTMCWKPCSLSLSSPPSRAGLGKAFLFVKCIGSSFVVLNIWIRIPKGVPSLLYLMRLPSASKPKNVQPFKRNSIFS